MLRSRSGSSALATRAGTRRAALPVLFAITVHEAAHGYVARHLGDNTADMRGRVTLNPLKHIEPIGTILLPGMLYFAPSGAFLFG